MWRQLLFERWALPVIACATVAVDQLSKLAVRASMSQSQSIPLIPQVFHLTYVRNPGAAFGLLPGKRIFFFATTGIVIVSILVYYLRAHPIEPMLVVGLGLALGGAIGNLIDRVAWGRVTDFFDFRIWPVFNVADSAVVIGLALVAVVTVMRSREAEREQEAV